MKFKSGDIVVNEVKAVMEILYSYCNIEDLDSIEYYKMKVLTRPDNYYEVGYIDGWQITYIDRTAKLIQPNHVEVYRLLYA